MLLLFFMLLLEEKAIHLSSSKHSVLNYPASFTRQTVFSGETVWIGLTGDKKSDEGLCIYKWSNDNLEIFFCTTPKDNLYKPASYTVHPSSENLYFVSRVGNIAYIYDKKNGLKRFSKAPYCNEVNLLNGDLYTTSGLTNKASYLLPQKDNKLLNFINTKISYKYYIPREPRDEDKLLTSVSENHIAFAKSLWSDIYIFDTKEDIASRRHQFQNPFRGYLAPPPFNTPAGQNLKKDWKKWVNSFHRLCLITWHKDQLYGWFRKGYDDHGVWARLDAPGYAYRNPDHEEKLLAVGPDRVIMGTIEEDDEGEVIWTLWQSSSLPSP